jgi:hypothetical protein
MTTLHTSMGRPATDLHDARRDARRRGAVTGLVVAFAIAAVEAIAGSERWIDLPIGLVGAIPAAMLGWCLGPSAVAERLRSAVSAVPAMAIGVVLVADAIVVVALFADSFRAGAGDPAAIVAAPLLYLWGLVLVGSPMLVITFPAAIIWLGLVRLWAPR